MALTRVLVWLWHDAKACGRRAWIGIIATLAVGSISPLIHLLTRPAVPPRT